LLNFKENNFIPLLILSGTSFFLFFESALAFNRIDLAMQLGRLKDNDNLRYKIEKIEDNPSSLVSINTQSQGNFEELLEALGELESGLPSGDPRQYQVENTLGFIGKYQFGEALLIDLGYYQAKVYYQNGQNGVDKNYWRGTWTGKDGIYSKSDFKNSSYVQELAIRQAFKLNLERINIILNNQGKSLSYYLGKTKTFNYRGQIQTISISLSGILAAAHLRGSYGVVKLLVNNQESVDEYGTSIFRYLDEFAHYTVTQSNLNF